MTKRLIALLPFALMILLSIAMHLPIFRTDIIGVHLWRQSQTQLNIQNFYRHDFNILNPRTNQFNTEKTKLSGLSFPLCSGLLLPCIVFWA